MIITVPKPFPEILENLHPYGSIFVVGCAACATKCQTGNENAVKQVADALTRSGKVVAGYGVLDTPCDMRIVKKDMGRSPEVASSEAILVLACGAGAQSIERIIDKPIYPGLDPVFVGTTERIGLYHEYCVVCGDCILHKTGGICPLSRCAKGLLNGPCGGTVNGKCEIDLERDCAWTLIYEKLQKAGREKTLDGYIAPRRHVKPGRVLKKIKE